MENFIKKITSRKFLLSAVGVVASVALVLGADAGEIESTVSVAITTLKQIAGILGALGCVISYNSAESKIDAAAVKNGK